MASNSPAGYSGTQILLHWLIAALVLFQVFFGDGMEHAYHALLKGKEANPSDVLEANIHVYVGFAVLALAVLRVIIRWTRGVPGAPAGQSGIKLWIAAATQVHSLCHHLRHAGHRRDGLVPGLCHSGRTSFVWRVADLCRRARSPCGRFDATLRREDERAGENDET